MPTPADPPSPRPAGPRLVVAAGLLVAAGFALRAWGAGAGAPYRMGVDEPFIIANALRMLRTGDFNPHFFDYGGLTIYLHAATAALAFLRGAMDGRWSHLDGVWEGDLLVPGRLLSAAFGAATVLCVFLIGRRWGSAVALLAAATMAVMPSHVREAHFILTDTPLTAFIALTLLLSVRVVERRRLIDVALAAGAVGLATAVKYNGAVAMLMPLLATAAMPAGRRLAGLALVPVVAAVTFLVCAPYTVLDAPGFLNGVALLFQSYNQERPLAGSMGTYLAYLRNWFTWPGVLPAFVGYGALILTAIGLVARLRTGDRSARATAALALAFAATYFVFVATQSLQYGRYLLPIGPMVALGLGAGLVSVTSRLARPSRRQATLILVALLVLAPPTATAISWNRAHARTTTADLMAQWIVDHTTRTDRIVIEAQWFHLPPWIRATRTTQLTDRTLDDYRRDGVTLLVTSTEVSSRYYADPATSADALAAHRELMARTTPVATIVSDASHPGATFTVLRVPSPD